MSTLTGAGRTAVSKTEIVERLKHNNFDGLRMIFAAMVVVFHIGILSQAPLLIPVYKSVSSLFAVQAFFVVSGFLVTMSFENTHSLVYYFRKRTMRIFPAYVACVLIAAILLVTLSTLPPDEYFASPEWRRYVLFNLALSNFAQPTLPGVFADHFEPAVNGSLWTIKLEVMFYCVVPFIVWAVRRFGYIPVLATIFVLSIGWNFGFRYLGEATGSDFFVRFAKQLPGQLAFFAGGAWAYYRTRQGLPSAPLWAAVLGIVAYALSDGLVNIVVAPFCVTAIVYFAAISVPQVWSAERWGDFSYGLYLYHFPIAQAAITLGVFAVTPILGLITVFAVSAIVALLSWHFLEKRALALSHRMFARPTRG